MTAPKRGRTTPAKVKGAPEPVSTEGLTAEEITVAEAGGPDMISEGGPPDPEDEGELAMVPQQIQGVRVPMPGIPLPLNLFFGLVPLGNQPVILVTAVNDAGSMIQGYFAPELAAKIGRDLVKAARDAEIERSRALITPAKVLLLPG
jgi:hypothetical protein